MYFLLSRTFWRGGAFLEGWQSLASLRLQPALPLLPSRSAITTANGLQSLSRNMRTMRSETPPSDPSSAGATRWLGASASKARTAPNTAGRRRRQTVSTSCLATNGTVLTVAMATKSSSSRCRRRFWEIGRDCERRLRENSPLSTTVLQSPCRRYAMVLSHQSTCSPQADARVKADLAFKWAVEDM